MGSILALQKTINKMFSDGYEKFANSPEAVASSWVEYNQEKTSGFYEQQFEEPGNPPGNRSPNKAHMSLFQTLWEGVIEHLSHNGMELHQTPRQTFRWSLEYPDSLQSHEHRYFFGTIISKKSQLPFALYVLDVAHHHENISNTTPIFPHAPKITLIEPFTKIKR